MAVHTVLTWHEDMLDMEIVAAFVNHICWVVAVDKIGVPHIRDTVGIVQLQLQDAIVVEDIADKEGTDVEFEEELANHGLGLILVELVMVFAVR